MTTQTDGAQFHQVPRLQGKTLFINEPVPQKGINSELTSIIKEIINNDD